MSKDSRAIQVLTSKGVPQPLGAIVTQNGVNFSVFSQHATSISLDLFINENDDKPYFTAVLDADNHRTGNFWHIHIEGLKPNSLYLYRVDGPFKPENGFRFNKNIYLLDPYTKAITDTSIFKNRPADYGVAVDIMDVHFSKVVSAKNLPKCVVIDDNAFDWEGDKPLNYPMNDVVIYETHLKGFTKDASSKVKKPGTYSGLTEKIPYLKELGVTSVELLPIHEFDEHENDRINPRTGGALSNYWGYSTISFFAPKASFASTTAPGEVVTEFKEMVKLFHKAGIEIILDVVFNHTAEGNERGITLNLRGFDNSFYYMLESPNKQYYKNYSGCGNTVNCNNPIVQNFILDCLRYWVEAMHVDGFRFDLASILGRDPRGAIMQKPPLLRKIAEDPILKNTKIIAEAWDAGGAYQVGNFPGGERWSEWNDKYRDDLRRFWRGDPGGIASVATRLSGSSDIYIKSNKKPFNSINFITSHDGFTMNDLVSYNYKHNEENGEQGRDGSDNNLSNNLGFEGATTNPVIEECRSRQIKNFFVSLMFSQGTPMFVAGDEFRRTQNGNNNAYCQDNEVSWVDWSLKEKNEDVFRFACNAIKMRLSHPVFRRTEFFSGTDHSYNSISDITWYDETGKNPKWDDQNHFIAFQLDGNHLETLSDTDDNCFYVMINGSDRDISVKIPSPPKNRKWYRCIDTSVASPSDFLTRGKEEKISKQLIYILPGKSSAVLIAKKLFLF